MEANGGVPSDVLDRTQRVAFLTSERQGAKMFGDGAEGGDRQEQQRTDQDDRSQQHAGEGKSVGPHRTHGERRRLLHGQAGGQGHGGDHRQEAAQQHHQARGDVPGGILRDRRLGVLRIVGTPCRCQTAEFRAVVCRGRTELVERLRRTRGPRDCSWPSVPSPWPRNSRWA